MIMSLKQKKRKFKPRIKLNCNIDTALRVDDYRNSPTINNAF